MRGYLAGFVGSTILATWTTPDATPGLIRAVTGRLAAALYYRERYSEDSLEDPIYAKNLYDEAMAIIMGIVAGTIVLEEVVDPSPTGERFDRLNFYVGDDTEPEPRFRMDLQL